MSNNDSFPGLIRAESLRRDKKVVEFAVHRTKTLYLLGYFLTPLLIGLLTISFLVLITAYFMVKSDLSLLSIIFAVVFTLPVTVFLHYYAVKPSNKILSPITKVIREKDMIYIHNVFPNVARPRVHQFKLSEVKDYSIYAAGSIGFRIEIHTKEGKVPLGLFATEEEANMALTFFKKHVFFKKQKK